jgi:hypothetical protein
MRRDGGIKAPAFPEMDFPEIDGCPTFASAYVGRERSFSNAFPELLTRTYLSKAVDGADPGFPVQLVTSAHLMRLSLTKAAHVVVSSAAYRKSGSPRLFRPRYALANLGHPSSWRSRISSMGRRPVHFDRNLEAGPTTRPVFHPARQAASQA